MSKTPSLFPERPKPLSCIGIHPVQFRDMTRCAVLVTLELPDKVESEFRERLDARFLPGGLPPKGWPQILDRVDAVAVAPSTRVDAGALSRFPSVRESGRDLLGRP